MMLIYYFSFFRSRARIKVREVLGLGLRWGCGFRVIRVLGLWLWVLGLELWVLGLE